jgi:hypothetical protein
MARAASAVRQSDLAGRVGAWRSRIGPALQVGWGWCSRVAP